MSLLVPIYTSSVPSRFTTDRNGFVHHIDPPISTQKEQLIATPIHLTIGSSIASPLQVLCKSVWPCAAKRYY